VHAGPWRHLLWIVLHDNGDLLTALGQQRDVMSNFMSIGASR
jgi:hypothetical protein